MDSTLMHAAGMRLRPNEIAINAQAPYQEDKLSREPFVSATTQLLASIREPFVIALNAPWGSGKTTALRLLEASLAASGMQSVSFNAWEVDHSTDPLVPLVASLHDRLHELESENTHIDSKQLEQLKILASRIAKHGTIAAVKLATAGLLDLASAAEGFGKIAGDTALKGGEDLAANLIDDFKKEQDLGKQFRELLAKLASHAASSEADDAGSRPLVLIVDELDRCRPTFAVAMLERIKHFFSVPGLVFVLGLDLEQLRSSTRKVYGAELDAQEYLRRFVDLELRLPRASLKEMIKGMLTSCGADAFFAARSNLRGTKSERESVVTALNSLASNFELSPRLVQRLVSRLMLVIRQTPSDHHLDPLLVVFMIFLRVRDEELLRGLVRNRVEAAAAMQAVAKLRPGGQTFYESNVGMLIEAHLLFAHNGQDYVAHYLQRITQLGGQPRDEQTRRMLEVGHLFEMLRNASTHRRRIDLQSIEQRINLVAADLVVDDHDR